MIERSRSARTIVGALLLVAGLASMASAQPAQTSVVHLSLEGAVSYTHLTLPTTPYV